MGPALVGLVGFVLFVGLIALTAVFLNGGFESGTAVSAVFSSPGAGQQLVAGGDVKVKGVLVGHISGIDLNRSGNAVVRMRLDDGVEVPADSRAKILAKTLFGQKYVALVPPPVTSGPDLRAGSVIDDEHTTEPIELEHSLQLGHELLSQLPLHDLVTILHALRGGFSGQEGDARHAIDNGLVALRAINSRAPQLDLALRQLRETSEWLDENDDSILQFMRSLDSANRALVGAAPEFRSSLQSLPTFLDDLASFQERTEGDLGRLVESGATLAELLQDHRSQLVDLVVELQPFTTVWNSGLRQPCHSPYETNLTCWQVYQPPGQASRGLYHGDGPLNGLLPARAAAPTRSVSESLAKAAGRPAPTRLARVLWAPVQTRFGDRLGTRP